MFSSSLFRPPVPLCPWHRLVTCSHLLLLLWGLFCSLCRGPSPLRAPVSVGFWPCFPCSLCGCCCPGFSFCCGSCWSFLVCGCFACVFAVVFFCLCVLLFVLWGVPPFLFCLWVVLSFAGFSVLWCGGSPPSFVPPSPLSVVPLRRPGPVLCWSLPLGIWLLHATARLPCFNAWGVVVLCFLASFCFMAAKAIWPCVGICVPSTPWCICCCGALCSCTEVFIFG